MIGFAALCDRRQVEVSIIGRCFDSRAKICVPNRSAGQVLCLSLAKNYVSSRRKSLYDGRSLAKFYVSQHCGVGHSSWPLRHKTWPAETQYLAKNLGRRQILMTGVVLRKARPAKLVPTGLGSCAPRYSVDWVPTSDRDSGTDLEEEPCRSSRIT